ncbi:hypothetical protein PED40_14210 [Staphylococcus aureus]|nr:hypothetical protein [Staphylococcus aureus]
MSIFFPVIIYVIILALQYFLSRTGSKILGLIMPVVLVVGVTYGYMMNYFELGLMPSNSLSGIVSTISLTYREISF